MLASQCKSRSTRAGHHVRLPVLHGFPNKDVRADHAESIDKHRKDMQHTMLAHTFFSPVRIHRTDRSVENMLNGLEREHRRECDDTGDATDDELATSRVGRNAPRPAAVTFCSTIKGCKAGNP